MTDPSPVLYSRDEAAARLGISVSTLHRLMRRGEISYTHKITGDLPKVSKEELDRFVETRKLEAEA